MHPISESTMKPSTSTDTKNRTCFGTLRKNVVVMVCVLGLVTYSLVSSRYSIMRAYVPESQSVPNVLTTPKTTVSTEQSSSLPSPLGTERAHHIATPQSTVRYGTVRYRRTTCSYQHSTTAFEQDRRTGNFLTRTPLQPKWG
jgi:hypothetical protein